MDFQMPQHYQLLRTTIIGGMNIVISCQDYLMEIVMKQMENHVHQQRNSFVLQTLLHRLAIIRQFEKTQQYLIQVLNYLAQVQEASVDLVLRVDLVMELILQLLVQMANIHQLELLIVYHSLQDIMMTLHKMERCLILVPQISLQWRELLHAVHVQLGNIDLLLVQHVIHVLQVTSVQQENLFNALLEPIQLME